MDLFIIWGMYLLMCIITFLMVFAFIAEFTSIFQLIYKQRVLLMILNGYMSKYESTTYQEFQGMRESVWVLGKYNLIYSRLIRGDLVALKLKHRTIIGWADQSYRFGVHDFTACIGINNTKKILEGRI